VSPSRQPGIRARLEARRDVAEGLAIFRVHLEADFAFSPGQYATLWLTHGGKTIPRPYSIASSPTSPRTLEFYINLVEHGRLTPSLWEPGVVRALAAGTEDTTLVVTGPHGRMVLEQEERRDLVLVASGTGLSPFMSMIRSEEERFQASPETYERRRIYVIHGVSYSANLGYREELEALARRTLTEPARALGLVYLPTISRPQMDRLWNGLTGRAETIFEGCGADDAARPLDLEVRTTIRAMLRPDRHAVYVCGHPGTIDNTVRILSTLGFRPRIDLKCEKYYA